MTSQLADPPNWMSVDEAASVLGVNVLTLRRALERHARRTGGCVHASVDGVHARKLGRRWRVQLDAGWFSSGERAG